MRSLDRKLTYFQFDMKYTDSTVSVANWRIVHEVVKKLLEAPGRLLGSNGVQAKIRQEYNINVPSSDAQR